MWKTLTSSSKFFPTCHVSWSRHASIPSCLILSNIFFGLVISLSPYNTPPSLIYSPPQKSLGVLRIYYFYQFQLTIFIGTWGVCYHDRYIKVFTPIKHIFPTVTRVLSTNNCFFWFTVGQSTCRNVNSTVYPTRDGDMLNAHCQWIVIYNILVDKEFWFWIRFRFFQAGMDQRRGCWCYQLTYGVRHFSK